MHPPYGNNSDEENYPVGLKKSGLKAAACFLPAAYGDDPDEGKFFVGLKLSPIRK